MSKISLKKVMTEAKHDFDAPMVRLRVGDIIDLGKEGHHLVWLVNECRAACIPVTRRAVEFTTLPGKEIRFESMRNSVNISPDSEVPILQRLGKTGIVEFLEKQKQERQNMSTQKNTSKKEEAPRLGRLGGFLGHPITAVIRAMAKAGWEYWECRAAFDKAKIKVADNTIRIQLSAGRAGEGEPAPVSKAQLAEIRPDESEKPASARTPKDKKGAKKDAAKAKSKDKSATKSKEKDQSEAKPKKKAKHVAEDDEGPEEGPE